MCVWASQVLLMVKTLPASAGGLGNSGSIPGSGRSPGGGHGNPLQCSCLENPMDRRAWWATVHGVTKSRTRLSDWTQQQHVYLCLCIFFFSGIFSEGQTSCSSILKYSHLSFIRTRTFSYVIIVHLSIRKLSSGATLLYNLHLILRFQELSHYMLFRSSFLGILLCYSLSHVWLFSTPWTVTSQASLSMGFSRQEYWSGLPSPSPGNFPKPGSPALLLDSLLPELPPWIHTIALIPVPALQDSLWSFLSGLQSSLLR